MPPKLSFLTFPHSKYVCSCKQFIYNMIGLCKYTQDNNKSMFWPSNEYTLVLSIINRPPSNVRKYANLNSCSNTIFNIKSKIVGTFEASINIYFWFTNPKFCKGWIWIFQRWLIKVQLSVTECTASYWQWHVVEAQTAISRVCNVHT